MAHLFCFEPALICLCRELADCKHKMPDFTDKRFDNRILDREDDGGAFERFVDEFLRIKEPEASLVRGLAKGPDGAIDLADCGAPITRIVECKFIGADARIFTCKFYVCAYLRIYRQ